MAAEFIGRGWAFPLRADATGSIALVGADTEIEEAIRLILATAPGERVMRPEFGCGMHDHVFDSMDATTAGQVAYAVQTALEQWEPRIDVSAVDVSYAAESTATIYIDIRYTVRATNDPRNLVFPFYVIPAEGEG
ncbi:MAG: GPW/gp25 family protein [Actinomycetota bacterium]|nr:GPW/gp25 family protein [Actinomycetota bacterium]